MSAFKPEVLSPAGNIEMLTAAVRCGADAVYLGLNSFNARRNAENFNLNSLAEAVAFCHIRGVKVYLTLNIQISDTELSEAVANTVAAANCGIDGVITADIGFASALHSVMPTLPIHASTQMTVHSPSAIKPLKEMGFSRVVVSREMSKPELIEFCKTAKDYNMEVEVFVHGALCMSMSGQCLLSAMLGGRSGNRGLCAGPCRLPFGAQNGNGFDLSLKDLSLIPYLSELSDMGVASLKIEGRMKRPEYVAAATTACRQMLDNGFVAKNVEDALSKVFSRSGFTSGYYTENLGKDMFGIRTKDDVTSADTVFASLHELYRNERQSVALKGEVELKENAPLKLTVSDGENTVTLFGEKPEKAINRPLDEQTLIEKISKTGGTPYFFESIKISLENGLTIKASAINELRRTALEKLSSLRASVKTHTENPLNLPKSERKPPKNVKTVIRIDNLSQLTNKAQEADLVLVPLRQNPEKLPKINNLAVELPRGISAENEALSRLKLFAENGIKTAFCGTLAATEIARQFGMNIVADFGFNTFNSNTLKYFEQKGVKAAVLSPEMLISQAKSLKSNLPIGIISYGRIPLMLTRNCPIKNGLSCEECKRDKTLCDRKDTLFPVRCNNGYSELLNSKVIWLADRQNEFNFLDFQVLYFTTETPDRVDSVISAYMQNLSPDCEFTRGLYYRGVE